MAATSNDLFYTRLPVNELSLGDLLMDEHLFYGIPESWHIVITDIQESTRAVNEGKHENVNLVATGSMVAVLNLAYKAGITVPSFFGGDGATFIIPPALLPATMKAMEAHKKNTLKTFNLRLRVGSLQLADIYTAGHLLTVSKLRMSPLFAIPVVLGDGLAYAEKIIKGSGYSALSFVAGEDELDLSGMQCRWDTVDPPDHADEVVSLLVVACEGMKQAVVFKKVIDKLDEIYGGQEKRKPISVMRLRLKRTIRKFVLEMRTKFVTYNPFYLANAWLTALLAPYYFKTKKERST